LETLGVDRLPLGAYIEFNGRLAAGALAGAVLLGILISLPIAWFNLHGRMANALQSGARGSTAGRAAQSLRHSFIVAQIALAFVLLTGAGLLGISLKRVLETSPGFEAGQVLTGQLSLPYKNYPTDEKRLAVVERLLSAIRTQPGVVSAAVGTHTPFSGTVESGITAIEGVRMDGSASQRAHYRNGVAGDYWRVMRIPLIEGRLLQDSDNSSKQRVCVVDQAFARRYWPGQSALGHRLNDGPIFKKEEAFTIVGVTGSVKQNELDDTNPLGEVYYPYKYWQQFAISVVVQTAMVPEYLGPALRTAVLQVDPELPIDKLKPMNSLIDESLVTRRSPAVLAGIFAAVALLLTAVGTYGVLAYAVRQRRREIGVRMALGALPSQVLAQFLNLGGRLLLVGLGLGLLGAWAAGRAMQTLLFGIGSVHPGVLAATAGVMIGVVFLASFLPSRRASLVSPTEALREE
jgi:predicted permease